MEDKDPIICPRCNGAGFHPYNPNWRCPVCNGRGEITEDCEDDRYTFFNTEDNATERLEAAS